MRQTNTETDEIGRGQSHYTRRVGVEAEISALPIGVGIEFRVALAWASAPETVVYGIRRLRRAGDDEGAQALIDRLMELAKPILERAARKQFPNSAEDRQDTMQEAALQTFREVLDLSPKQAFWEFNFTSMIVRACSDAARKMRSQRGQERPFRRSDDGTWDEELLHPDPAFSDPDDHAFLDDVVLGEALTQLDGDVRRAILLKVKGLKIASKDPNEQTISVVLGVSGRTVQNYLREGEATLRCWLQ